MSITWRLLLLSGLISLLIGILNVTSLIEEKTKGLNVWGYLLLVWGIVAIMSALNRFNYTWINKLLAALGILLHGTLAIYWLLFPEGETKGMNSASVLYALASLIAAFCCTLILGKRIENSSSRSISK